MADRDVAAAVVAVQQPRAQPVSLADGRLEPVQLLAWRHRQHLVLPSRQTAEAAIRVACRELHLPTIAEQGPRIADDATRERLTHRGFLAEER